MNPLTDMDLAELAELNPFAAQAMKSLYAHIGKPANPLAHNTDDDEPHPAIDDLGEVE